MRDRKGNNTAHGHPRGFCIPQNTQPFIVDKRRSIYESTCSKTYTGKCGRLKDILRPIVKSITLSRVAFSELRWGPDYIGDTKLNIARVKRLK